MTALEEDKIKYELFKKLSVPYISIQSSAVLALMAIQYFNCFSMFLFSAGNNLGL
jgi:hypothetical protein